MVPIQTSNPITKAHAIFIVSPIYYDLRFPISFPFKFNNPIFNDHYQMIFMNRPMTNPVQGNQVIQFIFTPVTFENYMMGMKPRPRPAVTALPTVPLKALASYL